jgi:phenylpropionate dioxygenase-like ring-hydroxylating dioxygenase large terminal subunit
VVEGTLECGYHGWRFDLEGSCRAVPGLCGASESKGRAATAYPVREQDGYVWVYPTAEVEPEREPFRFPFLSERGYTTVHQMVEARGSLHAVAENALDVPHTAFLHRGLFRGTGEPNRIDVVVRRWHDRVEAEYQGEPPPPGWAARILGAGAKGATVYHADRFFMPCVAQVEYRLGTSHFCVTTALTPVRDDVTRLYAAVTFKVPLPHFLVAWILKPLAMRIFRQDAEVLAAQTDTIRRFGGEQFVSTDADVLGQHILRLLKSAERGDREPPTEEPFEKRLQLEV